MQIEPGRPCRPCADAACDLEIRRPYMTADTPAPIDAGEPACARDLYNYLGLILSARRSQMAARPDAGSVGRYVELGRAIEPTGRRRQKWTKPKGVYEY